MAVFTNEYLEEIREEVIKAKKARHRRMLVIVSDDASRLIMGALEVLHALKNVFGSGTKLIYAYHVFFEDGVERKRMFEKGIASTYQTEYISYHVLDKILGKTYNVAVIDLLNNLEPNDIGRLMGVVEGGGLYILLMPSFDTLFKIVTRFQSNLLTPQYTVKDLRRYFEKRFVRKLMEHSGIAIYDADRTVFIKRFPKEKIKSYKPTSLTFPEKSKIPRKVFQLALTQDQVNVLTIMGNFYKKIEDKKLVFVLTADRGRGKSSAIGLALGGIAHKLRRAKGKCRIIVTAPNETNVQEVFRFAARALAVLKHKVDIEEKEGYIIGVYAKGIEIEYYKPLAASKAKCDIIAVDEAASIHVPMLFSILKNHDKVVFSSTVHGYEGAGRGFSIRFLKRLRSMENIEIYEYEMGEPIRYAPEDPIEKWVFDTLLLDAEPAKLDEKDLEYIAEKKVEYYIPDLEEFFLENEKELRQFFGIYIMAHYRNNPNDLGIMMDAPHHFVRALKLPSNKIVVSLELAEEGLMGEEIAKESAKGAWIMGNIIPDRLIKHYKLIDFGELKGIRIVRIATHPDVMRQGLGSLALKFLEEEARSNCYDWIGAGFGVTRELLKFWLRNGYTPVHMSPERNPVSGEYSIIVVKPLNEKAKRFIDVISWEFKKKILGSLTEPYHDLDLESAKMILESTPTKDLELKMETLQKARFLTYAWSDMTLENCMDVVSLLARHYFMSSKKPEFTDFQKKLLIAKVLQAKSWRVACNDLGVAPPIAMKEIKNVAKKLSETYLDVKSEEEALKFFFLKLEDITREEAL